MTEKTKGFWFMAGGGLLLLLGLDVIVKTVFILLGLWMIDRGMKLRGASRLSERARVYFYTFMR